MTKREIILLIALGVLMFTLALLYQFTSFEMTEGWEMLLATILFFTLGPYIALDPERLKRKGK